jgi:hypothetical protein
VSAWAYPLQGANQPDESSELDWSETDAPVGRYRPRGPAILEYSSRAFIYEISGNKTSEIIVVAEKSPAQGRRALRALAIIAVFYLLTGGIVALTQHNQAAEAIVTTVVLIVGALAFGLALRRN